MIQDWIQYEKKMLPLMCMPPPKQVLLSLNLYVALGFFPVWPLPHKLRHWKKT